MKYEDGKFMIKDIGAARAEYYGGSSFQNMALVNGWWVCEISEEEYESATKFAYFYGANKVWYTVYVNGTQESWFTIYHTEDVLINLIIYYPVFAVCYIVGDYSYYDEYESNSLKLHAVETYYLDNIVKVEYNYDGKEHTAEGYTYSENLLDGHTIECEVEGSRMDVGSTKTKLKSCVILDEHGNDVTKYYNIIYVEGEIKIV
jgi:hypothetical protein